MKRPESAAELERAARAGELVESETLEVKAEISGRPGAVATHVCAMTLAGGLVIYGIGEDQQGRPTVPKPFSLRGQREHVADLVRGGIAEPPRVVVHALPLADDPDRGYLIVEVPASDRAPHQVIVGEGEGRYFGRGAAGRRILIEGEIARLYAQRGQPAFDAAAHLDELVRSAPEPPSPRFSDMHAFVRPRVPDPGIGRAALGDDTDQSLWNELLVAAQHAPLARGDYEPALRHGAQYHDRTGDAWILTRRGQISRDEVRIWLRCAIRFDGEVRLFCGRAGDAEWTQGKKLLFDGVVAGNFASLLGIAGAYLERAGYAGGVDVGVRLTGLKGGELPEVAPRLMFEPHYPDDDYERTASFSANELRPPEPITVRLLGDFAAALWGAPRPLFKSE